MKDLFNIFKLMVITISLASLALGQGMTGFGAKAGLNLANQGGADADDDAKMKIGFAVGGFATFDFGLPVLIQAELLYSQKGWKYDEDEYTSTVTLNYIDINPLALYPINDQINVIAGLNLAMPLGGKSKWEFGDEEDESDIETDELNGTEFGLIIGGSYNLGPVNVEARYNLGLKSVTEDEDIMNNVIQIMAAYSF
jgi:hypothetical protein